MTDVDIYGKCVKLLLSMNDKLLDNRKIAEPAVQEQARRNVEEIIILVDLMNQKLSDQ